MSGKKYTFDLNFLEVVPRLMDWSKARNYRQLAEALEIKPQSITNYKKRGKVPLGLVFRFAIKNRLSIDNLIGLPGASKIEDKPAPKVDIRETEMKNSGNPPPSKMQLENLEECPRRRIEDNHYCEVKGLKGVDDLEEAKRYPFLKLYLRKELFGRDCHLSSLSYMVLNESNMYPNIPAGSILLIDHEDRRITESLYVIKMNDAYILKRLQPVDGNKIRVISDNPKFETVTIDRSDISPNISGRVIWVASRV
jgi:hypothetical protein